MVCDDESTQTTEEVLFDMKVVRSYVFLRTYYV